MNSYRSDSRIDLQKLYVNLLCNNVNQLVDFIYQSNVPFDIPQHRVAVCLQLVVLSDHKLTIKSSNLIIKDLQTLKNDTNFLKQWDNPQLKRQCLNKEIEIIKQHTDIDDSMSLNQHGHENEHGNQQGHVGQDDNSQYIPDNESLLSVATLNTHTSPVELDNLYKQEKNACVLM